RKRLEPVERAFLIEHHRVAFEREGRVEDARAAARRFLRVARVRRAVGAEEDILHSRRCGLPHSLPMLLPLCYRETVSMWPQPACKDRIPIDDEVLRRDGRSDPRSIALDEVSRVRGRDMLQNN